MYLQGGIFSKVYYQVLLIIHIFFFWRAFHFVKRMPDTFLLCANTALFHLVKLDGKQGRSEPVSGPPWTLPRALWCWLAALFPCRPPPEGWKGAHFLEHSLAAGQKRPGEGAQEHKIFMYLGHRASHRKSKTREAHCLKKYM